MRTLFRPRPGVGFHRLRAASAVSNLGDGVTMAAGPLLLATLTGNPALIAGGALAGQLPWLLFALVSGAYADRLDRRRLIVAVNLVRAATIGVLTVAIATGHVSVPLVYAVAFVLGVAETLADTAAGALMPAIVAPEHLDRANARLGAMTTVVNQFAAKPFGAWLYGIAAAVPFGLNAVTFVLAALLIAGLPGVPPADHAPRASLRTDILEGLRWLWRHPLLRTIAITMGLGNIVYCAAFAVFILYARDRRGLAGRGFGFLLTAFAAGGLIGSLLAVRIVRRLGATTALCAGLLVEAGFHLTLATTTSPWVAAAAIVVFGVHTMVWGITVTTLGQRIVPRHLLGRVRGVYMLLESAGPRRGRHADRRPARHGLVAHRAVLAGRGGDGGHRGRCLETFATGFRFLHVVPYGEPPVTRARSRHAPANGRTRAGITASRWPSSARRGPRRAGPRSPRTATARSPAPSGRRARDRTHPPPPR